MAGPSDKDREALDELIRRLPSTEDAARQRLLERFKEFQRNAGPDGRTVATEMFVGNLQYLEGLVRTPQSFNQFLQGLKDEDRAKLPEDPAEARHVIQDFTTRYRAAIQDYRTNPNSTKLGELADELYGSDIPPSEPQFGRALKLPATPGDINEAAGSRDYRYQQSIQEQIDQFLREERIREYMDTAPSRDARIRFPNGVTVAGMIDPQDSGKLLVGFSRAAGTGGRSDVG